MSQAEFGAVANISFRAVSLIETGRQRPSAQTVVLWARHFGEDFGLSWVREQVEGRTQTRDAEETGLIEDFREMSPETKKLARTLMSRLRRGEELETGGYDEETPPGEPEK